MANIVTMLLTGIGAPGAYGIIRSLRQAKDIKFRIIGMDINPQSVARTWVDRFVIGPKATDEGFVDGVKALCQEENIQLIFPAVSKELYPLALAKDEFSIIGTTVAVSTPESIAVANHKGKLLDALRGHGVPIPEYREVQTVSELDEAIEALGYPENPVCFKPVYGDGSRGFHVLDANIDHVKRLFDEKPNSVYIARDELTFRLRHMSQIPPLVVMEYLPGDEYTVDLLVKHGKVLVAIPRCREATVGGLTTRGTIVKETDVIQYATRVVESIGLHGNIGVQVRRNANGEPRIIEVNPRLQGTTVHCSAAGVNLPYLGVKLALEQSIHAEDLDVQWGTKMTRYWEEIYFEPSGFPYAYKLL